MLGTFDPGHGRSQKQQDENSTDDFKYQHKLILLLAWRALVPAPSAAARLCSIAPPTPALIAPARRKIVPRGGTNDPSGSLVFRPALDGWSPNQMERLMQTKILGSMMLLAALALPFAAQAQGTVRGMERGAA
jgi:hypothetical protein